MKLALRQLDAHLRKELSDAEQMRRPDTGQPSTTRQKELLYLHDIVIAATLRLTCLVTLASMGRPGAPRR